jgi:mono/diheme cytochrome c family protein
MKKSLILIVLLVLATPAAVLADGRSDYNARCASCHGANANVRTEKAKALKMDIKKLSLKGSRKTNAEMVVIIETGKDQMPGFGKELSKKQINAIVEYIIALTRKS